MRHARSKTRRFDYLLALLVGLLAFVLYMRTLAPGLLAGDSGEFQFAAWLGGFAHPTGYPLYLLLGYLWTHLPLPQAPTAGGPAWRLNALSAVLGAVAVGLVYLLALRAVQVAVARRLPAEGARHRPSGRTADDAGSSTAVSRGGLHGAVAPLVALFAALTFAATPTFWSQAIIAEVYALHAAFVAAILLCLVIWSGRPHSPERPLGEGTSNCRPLYAAALLFGLSLAHHRSTVLLIPGIALFLWQDRKLAGGWRMRLPGGLVRVLLLAVLPLLLYVYIPLRAPLAPYAEVVISPERVLHLYRPTLGWFAEHVTGSTFRSAIRSTAAASGQVMQSAGWLMEEVSWAGVGLGVLGAIFLYLRSRPLFALTGGVLATFVLFNLFYGIGDIRVFYIPVYLVWCLWMGLGVAALSNVLARRAVLVRGASRAQRVGEVALSLAPCVLAFALPVAICLGNLDRIDQSRNNRAREMWEELLAQHPASVPENAILVTNDRDDMTPLWYLQYVEGVRRDVTGLFPLIQSSPEWADIGQVIDVARRSGRPVLLIKEMPGLEIKYRMQPAGALVRIAGPAIEKAPDRQPAVAGIPGSYVPFGDSLRLVGYDADPAFGANGGGDMAVTLYWQPLQRVPGDYTSFVHLVNAAGNVVGQSDHRPGGVYYPSSLWRPGELLADRHEFVLAPDLGLPPYRIEAGLYTLAPDLVHVGQPQFIGTVAGLRPPDVMPADVGHHSGVIFDDQIALDGYDVKDPATGGSGADVAGARLALALYWRALRAPGTDYAAFIHLLDESGRIVAQSDRQPSGGTTPTSTWPSGYVLADTVAISIPTSLSPGSYRVVAGLYDPSTLERLRAILPDGTPASDNAVTLMELTWPP